MKTFTINNLQVTDYGSANPPLIFVHAFPLDSRMWNEQAEYFKDKFRVITYDVRGLGKSYKDEKDVYTMETYADDLLSIIKELALENVNVCGLSMGGYIILRAVQKEPALFSKIILADTKADADDNTGLLGRAAMINKLQTQGKDFLLTEFLPKLISEEGLKNENLSSNLKEIITSQDATGIAKAVTAIALRLNHLENLLKISAPVLIVIGEKDKLTPLENSQKMDFLITDSRLEIIKNAGHISNMENPQDFNKAIENFLL